MDGVVDVEIARKRFNVLLSFRRFAGVQESLVLCVREEDKKIVSPYLCSRDDQPEVLTQTCNDQPCPPRWNVSDFMPCSQSCGIGLQMREVNCIHEVTEGNTAVVPSNMCPQPAPADRKQCNMVDCPTEWRTSEWSKVRGSSGSRDGPARMRPQDRLIIKKTSYDILFNVYGARSTV